MFSRSSVTAIYLCLGVVVALWLVFGFLALCISNDAYWTAAAAIWAALAAVGTCSAVGVAWYQIGEIKRQQQGWETLRMCNLYDVDPTLAQAAREIRKATGHYEDAQLDIKIRLNYFESVAIGIEQGFYDSNIVKAHLGEIIKDHVELYLGISWEKKLGFEDNFWGIRDLVAQWYPPRSNSNSVPTSDAASTGQ